MGVYDIKQVIVMRKDLNMRKGKMCAQAAHASMKAIFDTIGSKDESGMTLSYSEDSAIGKWMNGSFAKIICSVDNEEDLDNIYFRAKGLYIPCAMIIDNGATEFHGQKTKTCCAVGPCYSNVLDEFTGHLKLL